METPTLLLVIFLALILLAACAPKTAPEVVPSVPQATPIAPKAEAAVLLRAALQEIVASGFLLNR